MPASCELFDLQLFTIIGKYVCKDVKRDSSVIQENAIYVSGLDDFLLGPPA